MNIVVRMPGIIAIPATNAVQYSLADFAAACEAVS
jgi:hypothetical protein